MTGIKSESYQVAVNKKDQSKGDVVSYDKQGDFLSLRYFR